jgi:CBS domain-containing protein
MSLEYTVIEIFSSEDVSFRGRPLHEAVIDYVRGLKIAARCAVFKGAAGCYESGEVATPNVLELSYDMPLKIEILLPSAERQPVLSTLEEMVSEGVVALRRLELHSFRARGFLLPRQIKVRDVMTPGPKTVAINTRIKEIIRLLSCSNFYGVPVVDDDKRPIGMITEWDLIQKAGLPLRVGLLSEADWEHIDPALEPIADKQARDIMAQPVVSIAADDFVAKAVDQMVASGLKRLPVVDDVGRLVGMLSRWDVFRTITEVSPDWQAMKKHDVAVGDLRYVSDIMRRDTHTVRPEASIEDLMRLIDANDIQRVAVTDASGHYLGLISDRDLLAAFSEHYPGLWERFADKILFAAKGERHRLVGAELRSKRAADVMRTDLPTVQEHTSLDEAIRLMVEKDRKRLPVVDAEGRLSGLISRGELLHAGFGGR